MPRIPVRTEPYTSPSRQHRHFKNKRDQVLRALGKAAYINGSQFAIMWVSARGEVETYASDALQGRLDDWFVKRGIADEAKDLVRASRPPSDQPKSAAALAFPGLDIDDDDDVDDDDDDLDNDISNDMSTSATPNLTLNNNEDVFIDSTRQKSVQKQQARLDALALVLGQKDAVDNNSLAARTRRAMAPLDTNAARQHFQRDLTNSSSPNASGNGGLHLPIDNVEGSVGVMPHSAPLRGKSSMLVRSVSTGNLPLLSTPAPANAGLIETTFRSEAARTAFLELRFGQLQQGMCKTVSKAWIKIIEPKKQTRCPYNRGEEGKPDWWPQGVRHKEPDHLMKPERHALLLTILRSPKVKIARLQLATAEVVALMKADKVSLLMDVYRVAREEETRRIARGNTNAPMKVAVSTLEGWSEAEQCAVLSPERPSSPQLDDDSAARSAKKRAAASTPLSRSTSSSAALRANKRPATGMIGLGLEMAGPSSHPAMLDNPAALMRRAPNGPGSSTWLMHEPSRHGIKRTSVSSHSHGPVQMRGPMQAATNAMAPHQQAMAPSYGSLQPNANASQLMDPAFLGQNEHYGGYMSAPAQHAQLFPHGASPQMFNGQLMHPQQRPQPPPHVDEYAAYHGALDGNAHSSTQSSGGALGLQGVDLQWNMPNSFESLVSTSSSSGNWWETGGGPTEVRMSLPTQATAAHQQQALVPPPAVGDASFDNSFASTVESNGPATPHGSAVAQRHFNTSSSLSKAGLFPSTLDGSNRAQKAINQSPAPHQHGLGGQLPMLDAQSWLYSTESSQ